MLKLIKTLVDRYKKGKKFNKDTSKEAQGIFKKNETGGKRFYHPKNESRSDNIAFKRILEQVRDVRKVSPRKESKQPSLKKAIKKSKSPDRIKQRLMKKIEQKPLRKDLRPIPKVGREKKRLFLRTMLTKAESEKNDNK